jgi:S1-C subfamily serine protease
LIQISLLSTRALQAARQIGVRAVVIAALCVGAPPADADTIPSNVEELLTSIVSVLPDWPRASYNAEEPEGSGVVILDGRTIITAHHVVENARSVRVRTSNGVIMAATLAGTDAASDLALITIEEPLPALAFGGDAEIGDEACAIGNAFGLGLSVTCGTVSAVHRAGVGFNAVEDFVQTDAAVNPGASGGALVSADGTLIGILAAIFTKTSDANIGVNFAVAAPLAERVADELAASGSIGWNFGGAGLGQFPARGETGQMAAEVLQVRGASPAEVAGLAVGDRIVEAGGRRVRSPEQFRSVVARLVSGDSIDIVVWRGTEQVELSLQME